MSDPNSYIIENIWGCPTCHTSNQGRKLNCSKCGAPKVADVEDKFPGDPEIVINSEFLKKADAGPNWACPYCSCQVRNLEGECWRCGGNKDVISKIKAQQGTGTVIPWWAKGFSSRRTGIILCSSLLALGGIVWFFVWLFTPNYIDAKVKSVEWSYTINLRIREVRHSSGWGPPGNQGYYHEAPFNVLCGTRLRGTENCHPYNCDPHLETYDCRCKQVQCNCRQDCKDFKNGFTRCTKSCNTCSNCDTCTRTKFDTCWEQCPVYEDWCNYDYYEWPIQETKNMSGTNHNVQWPNIVVTGSTQKIEKTEDYIINFSTSNDMYQYNPKTVTDFMRFGIGDTWRLHVGKIQVHHIESLQRIKAEKD